MEHLYPLKFQSIFKEKIWGGQKLKNLLNKDFSPIDKCGESWEISGVKGDESKVKEGHLAGVALPELLNSYKDRLVGKKVYQQFGNEFPLLIKFLDANEDLSIQVHPDDELARSRHNSFGKTEMWYVLQADKGARLNTGFNKPVSKEVYLDHLNSGHLEDILNYEEAKEGDVFFLPAGRVHYIGKGLCIAEIQQTSDITYRIYDFDRIDKDGQKRELHTDLALDAIDYTYHKNYRTDYIPKQNEPAQLVTCPYFETNLITLQGIIKRNYEHIDSFVIFIVLDGQLDLAYEHGIVCIKKGETMLIPAEVHKVNISSNTSSKFLEVYIP